MRTKCLVVCVVGAVLLVLTSMSFAAEMRTWTRKNGKTFEAEFVEEHHDDGRNIVTLRKPDGTEMTIGFGMLIVEDRKYIGQHTKSAKSQDNKTVATEKPVKNPHPKKPDGDKPSPEPDTLFRPAEDDDRGGEGQRKGQGRGTQGCLP